MLRHRTLWRIRHRIEGLGPYQSLLLLAVPTSIVEPLKLIALALAIAGDGHWVTGTLVIVAAYATSLLLVERLFRIVKPKLMRLRWFASLWTWLVSLRVVRWLTAVKEAISRWISFGEACLVLGFAYLCSGIILALPFPPQFKTTSTIDRNRTPA
jgi:hypothetical protein